jgi:diguanylate cyclase (GGDEF)-like protein
LSEYVSEIRGCVLVMDHDRGRASRRCAQLIPSGWRTQQAVDPAEALQTVRSGEVDLVLLHVPADEAEAMDLPSVLRLAAEVPHLPVVVMAPAPAEQTRCEYLEGGADAILPDAISPAELSARLRALMRVKRLHDELRSSRQALAESLARERRLLAQLRRDNAHLLTLCATDPLTHLHNIRQFDLVLDNEFRIARRYNRRMSLLVLDLDHFKMVNDTHGHPSGDYVLKEFAVILKQSVRDSDVVARTGGEEFSILLPDASREQADILAARIGQTVRDHDFSVYGQQIRVTTSIGASSYPEDDEIADAQMLVYFADQALLHAKQLGRDRVVPFHELEAAERRRLRRQYLRSQPDRNALRPDPFVAHYVRP